MLQKYDKRNEDLIVYVNGELLHRNDAKISVFDSLAQGGDAVWEGIRVYNGKIFCLDEHLNRMQESAHTLAFANIPSNEEIKEAIFKTLKANSMQDETHIRLTLTRGEKITSGMDPRLNQKGCSLIVLAEWKPPVYPKYIKLITCSIRRNNPQYLDSKIHHNNLLNNILAKIEANIANADDALMLDSNGFVAETIATNVFMIKDRTVFTPFGTACLPGITRQKVIDICHSLAICCVERDLSVSEFYNAELAFTTGSMGELTLVNEIDGRKIQSDTSHPIFAKINAEYRRLTETEGELIK